MASNTVNISKKNQSDVWRERLLHVLIQLAGVGVLLLLLTMFVYMVYVAIPLLKPAGIEATKKIQLSEQVKAAWFDQISNDLHLLEATGSVKKVEKNGLQQVTTLATQDIAFAEASAEILAVQASDKSVKLYRSIVAANSDISGQPKIAMSTTPLHWFDIVGDEQHYTLVGLAENESKLLIIENGTVFNVEATSLPTTVEKVIFTKAKKQLFLLASGDLFRVTLNANWQVIEQQLIANQIKDFSLLSGADSLIMLNQSGELHQLFEVLHDGRRMFRSLKYQTKENTLALSNEKLRKVFFVLTETQLQIFYASDTSPHFVSNDGFDGKGLFLVEDDGAFIANINRDNELRIFAVDNPYPEVNWAGLWTPVHYENYDKPEYVWQTTAATDSQPAKYSLSPLLFGTIKAALFGLIFAAPLAISAAIYTGYFLTAKTRNRIRPIIEILEALPTVIIAMIAVVWLAPFFERYFQQIMLLLMFFPLSVVVAAYLDFYWPKKLEFGFGRFPRIMLILGLLLANVVFVSAVWPSLGVSLLSSDVFADLLSDSINQHNAIIVALALGFAMIPTVYSIAENAIFSVPKRLVSGSLALGATRWQTFKDIIIKMAYPSVVAALLIGFSRAAGETMIVLMVSGNTPIVDWDIFAGMRTIAATISMEIPEASPGGSHFRVIFMAALLLFLFTTLFNTIAEIIRQRATANYARC